MAFVTGLPLTASSTTSVGSRSSLSGTAVSTSRPSVCTTRMGYGDYSYLTDKTKGHVQQYYVDKFRIGQDFTKISINSQSAAMLGRDVKGAVYVPIEGIPQVFDPALPTSDEPTAPDPRLTEATGSVYPWDVNYEDPENADSTFADVSDEEVADNAFAQFRASVAKERGMSLTAMDFGAAARVNRILEGLDESYLLTLDGALEARYARLQKICNPPTFTPTGEPQTEIPGFPYMGSVGAMDFIEKPGAEIAFWKGKDTAELPYKKPSGSEMPELPYNTSAGVDALKEAQTARGLLPGN